MKSPFRRRKHAAASPPTARATRSTRAVAEKALKEFESFDYVVMPSGSCAGQIKIHFARLFDDDRVARARRAPGGQDVRVD